MRGTIILAPGSVLVCLALHISKKMAAHNACLLENVVLLTSIIDGLYMLRTDDIISYQPPAVFQFSWSEYNFNSGTV